MNILTSQDLRERLPGNEFKNVIASSTLGEGKQLIHVMEVRGCLDELITVHSFLIINGDRKYFFHNLNDAKNAWDNLDKYPTNLQYIRILN